ncbi:DDE superfamily endonuclease domain-containing protein [Ditylenchus destructor]|uniref:DDE superfamily endonuclease domain-containing protein n=1 Tax=Ditylenchus destructor TaxID=166010 RepID=A0AAD4NCH8_9BILA|nr:DDE superfamily endonuclease domain-containing protein [Ditylenchus destructor]
MRPHADPQYSNFYRAHAKTRRIVECAFGLWKNRFTCLKTGMRMKDPKFSCKIIKATGYLHNFLIQERTADENDDDDFMEQSHDEEVEEPAEEDYQNAANRFQFIYQEFRLLNAL